MLIQVSYLKHPKIWSGENHIYLSHPKTQAPQKRHYLHVSFVRHLKKN